MTMPTVPHRNLAMVLYRSDDRDFPEIQNAGGFVPKYLLEHHDGGFEGFLKCTNKTQGLIGCKCPGMDYAALLDRARLKFEELLKNPEEVQTHVIFNAGGYLSTALNDEETISATHRYKICTYFLIQGKVEKVRNDLNKTGLPAVKGLWKEIEFFLTPSYKMIAVKPKGGVELTFLTPIPWNNIKKVR